MAVAGRKPKPSATKRATGNPGKRKLPKSEPQFSGSVQRPEWMNRVELEEWDRIVPSLERVGIAKTVHQGALEGICVLYGAWRKARKDRDATQTRMAFDAYRKALNEFGLTAASAGRVAGGVDPNADDPSDEFFTGPKAVNE